MADMPQPGHYQGIADFINRNNLQDAFQRAIGGGRTIEEYLKENPESLPLVSGIMTHLSNGEWPRHVRYSSPHASNFTFKP